MFIITYEMAIRMVMMARIVPNIDTLHDDADVDDVDDVDDDVVVDVDDDDDDDDDVNDDNGSGNSRGAFRSSGSEGDAAYSFP